MSKPISSSEINGERRYLIPSSGGAGDAAALALKVLMIAAFAGFAWRVLRFALGFQFWGDEAYLAVNILTRDYTQLIEPLANRQVAPPLFLWLVKWLYVQIGTDWSMRIPAFAAAIAGFALFSVLAFRTLQRFEAWLAIAVFSVSYPLATYAVELKPYSTDVMIGIAMTLVGWAWLQHPQRIWPILVLGLLAAASVWISFATIFVIAGVGAVMTARLFTVPRQLGVGVWAAGLLVACLAGASAFLMYKHIVQPQQGTATSEFMQQFWEESFPPWNAPLKLPWWIIQTHTGKMFGYPFGGRNFGSALSTMCWIAGIVSMWRGNRRWLLAALLAPMAALFIASSFRLYPYGGHPRVTLFLGPSICIIMAAGLWWLVGFIKRSEHRSVSLAIVAAVLLIAGLVGAALDLKRWRDEQTTFCLRAALQQIKAEVETGAKVVCLNAPDMESGNGPKIEFEFYMHTILGDAVHWSGRMPDDLPSTDQRVFGIVFFTRDQMEPGAKRVNTWIQAIQANGLQRAGEQLIPIDRHDRESVMIIEFFPPEA